MSAAPQPLSAALHWVRMPGAEDCVSGAELTRQVEAQLGRPVFPSPREARVSIEGRVERVGGEYRAQLRMLGRDDAQLGSREITSAQRDCAELSETLVLVLALMIEPAASAPVPTPPAPPPAKPAEPQTAPPAPRVVERAPVNRLLGFARLGINMLNEPAYGFGGAYERTLGKLGVVRAEAVVFADKTQRYDRGQGATLSLAQGGLAYCPWQLSLWRVQLAPCLGAELGRIRSVGRDFVVNRSKSALWVSGSLAARATLPLTRALVLQLGAALLVPKRITYSARFPSAEDATIRTIDLLQVKQPAAQLDAALGARF